LKTTLTDRRLKALRGGSTYLDVWDAVVPGLGVRIAPSGRKTFVLMTRFGDKKNPTRRAIGTYGIISLASARGKAREWLGLVSEGKDPATQQRNDSSFKAVAGAFIEAKVKYERQGATATRTIRRLIDRWGDRQLADITPSDIRALLREYQDRPAMARSLFASVRRLYGWAINQGDYGIEHAPTDRLKAHALVGPRNMRDRVLSDNEIRAIWHADLHYPMQPLLRFMLLTGQRKSEVANATWREFDLDKRIWIIPSGRMKAGAAHAVPLSDSSIDLLQTLPRLDRGDYLFSFTFGARPAASFWRAKERIDRLMPPGAPPFVFHDIRRTVRTRLSGIPNISDLVRELAIGHTKPGLHKVYDLHAYEDEKRFALDEWASRLRSIVEPPPDIVTPAARS
jgi:integrase